MVLVIQIVLLIILATVSFDPISALVQKYQNNQIIAKVSDLAKIDPTQAQVLALINNIDNLKSASAVNANVYKDAKNGDYVIGIGTDSANIIIYRASENKVIYQGDSPNALLSKTQQQILNDIIAKTKEKKLIPADSTEIPQVTQVSDPSDFQKNDPVFYKSAQKDDVVAYFAKAQIVVLYRISSSSIVNSGKIK